MDKKEKLIGTLVLIIVCFIFLIVGYIWSKPKAYNSNVMLKDEARDNKENKVLVDNTESIYKNSNKNSDEEYKSIIVEIKGEVKNPNVYKMKSQSRLYELIDKAGGYTNKADKTCINASKKLKDEDCIIIYSKEEMKNNKSKIVPKERLSSPISNEEKEKININTATKEELKSLPGVGEVTAQKIIDYREKNGEFSSIDEITEIDRIGDKTLEKFKDKIDVR